MREVSRPENHKPRGGPQYRVPEFWRRLDRAYEREQAVLIDSPAEAGFEKRESLAAAVHRYALRRGLVGHIAKTDEGYLAWLASK